MKALLAAVTVPVLVFVPLMAPAAAAGDETTATDATLADTATGAAAVEAPTDEADEPQTVVDEPAPEFEPTAEPTAEPTTEPTAEAPSRRAEVAAESEDTHDRSAAQEEPSAAEEPVAATATTVTLTGPTTVTVFQNIELRASVAPAVAGTFQLYINGSPSAQTFSNNGWTSFLISASTGEYPFSVTFTPH